jgi:hypothetical protein
VGLSEGWPEIIERFDDDSSANPGLLADGFVCRRLAPPAVGVDAECTVDRAAPGHARHREPDPEDDADATAYQLPHLIQAEGEAAAERREPAGQKHRANHESSDAVETADVLLSHTDSYAHRGQNLAG